MAESVETVVSYLMARVSMLKDTVVAQEKELVQLRQENENLHLRLQNSQQVNEGQGQGQGIDLGNSTPLRNIGREQEQEQEQEGEEKDSVSESVLDAAKELSNALLQPAGSRPDLDIKGMTLLRAIRSNNAERIENIIEKNPDFLTMRSLSNKETIGFQPIHVAAVAGKTKAVEMLIKLGASPSCTDLVGRTALHLAASKVHKETVEALMKHMDKVKGEEAPQDLSGITPAGYSALSHTLHPGSAKTDLDGSKRKDSLNLLHEKGDACISPLVAHSRNPRRRKSTRRKSKLSSGMVVQRHVRKLPPSPVAAPQEDSQHNLNLEFGSASLPGYRVAMEDAICLATGLGPAENLGLFAVFDGHGGKTASDYCAEHICKIFESTSEVAEGNAAFDKDELSLALRKTCLQLEKDMSQLEQFKQQDMVVQEAIGNEEAKIEKRVLDKSGTTATIVVVTPTFSVCANIGDSRTIMIEQGDLVLETRDHKMPRDVDPATDAFWVKEVARIEEAGGAVSENGRVMFDAEKHSGNHMAMSRALGDFDFKVNRGPGEPQVLSPEPELYSRSRHSGPNQDQWIVLACDGVWDILSSVDCAKRLEILSREEATSYDASNKMDKIAERLALDCLDSNDNVSLIVVRLGPLVAAPDSFPAPVPSSFQEKHDVQRNLLPDLLREV